MNSLLLQTILQAAVLAMAIPPVLNSQPYRWILKRLKLDRAPMTCATCLGFWIALILGFLYWPMTDPILICLGAAMTGWLCEEADKIHTKIF